MVLARMRIGIFLRALQVDYCSGALPFGSRPWLAVAPRARVVSPATVLRTATARLPRLSARRSAFISHSDSELYKTAQGYHPLRLD